MLFSQSTWADTIEVTPTAPKTYTNTVPGNTSALTFDMQSGTLEFYNSTHTAVSHGSDNSICSGLSGGDITIQGTGTLKITNDNGTGTVAALNSNKSSITFALDKDSLIDVQGAFVNGGFQNQVWTGNYSKLNIGSKGVLDLWDGTKMQVSLLTGDVGAVIQAVQNGGVDSATQKGINIVGAGKDENGNDIATPSATYNGTINCTYRPMITKSGNGTQIFTGSITNATMVGDGGTLQLNGDLTNSVVTAKSGVTTINGALTNTTVTAQNGTNQINGTMTGGTRVTVEGGTTTLGTSGNDIVAKNDTNIYQTGGTLQLDGNLVANSDTDEGVVRLSGSWTGSGTITAKKGYLRIYSSMTYDNGIILDGGILHNSDVNSTLNAPITVKSDSSLKAGWTSKFELTKPITGSANLTILPDSGNIRLQGAASDESSYYTGNITINGGSSKGWLCVGKYNYDDANNKLASTENVNGTPYIGTGKIIMDGGILMNNGNCVTIANDIEIKSTSHFQSGWSGSTTLSGNLSGSGTLLVPKDSGTVIFQTKSLDSNPFTGDVQFDFTDASNLGKGKLATNNAFGNQVGRLNLYGQLDMAGYSQKFKGMISDGSKGNLYNSTSNKSTITLDLQSGVTSNYYGLIQNDIDLIVQGNGTQVFMNAGSSFTGDITVNSGTLKATAYHSGDNSTFGQFRNLNSSRTLTVNAGGELYLGTCNVMGDCVTAEGFYDNFIQLVVNGGKITTVQNNVLYAPILQNGAELYGTSPEATWQSIWFKGETKVSSASNGLNAEKAVKFNGASSSIPFVPYLATFNVDNVTKSDAADLIVNVAFADGPTHSGTLYSGSFTKTGEGTMELTTANSYTGGTTISEGTLRLSGTGNLGTGTTKIEDGAMLDFNVTNGKSRSIVFGGTESGYERFYKIEDSGSSTEKQSQIVKTGDGDLKILLQAEGQISADKFVVSSGRLDIKSALLGEDGYVALESNIDVLKDATFSPGNSVGILQLATGKTINVETGGKLLLEIGGTTTDKNDQIIGDGSVVFQPGSIIELALDPTSGYTPQNGQKIELNVPESVTTALQNGTATFSSYYFQLYNVGTGEFYIGINPNAVPEPSTWALLILGFVGLMWYRKRERR